MSFRRIAAISVCSVLVFAYFVLAKFPASQGLALASKFSQGSFLYANATGTIWQGKAEKVLISTSQQVIDLGQTQWQLSAWPLLTAKVKLNLQSKLAQQVVKTELTATPNKLTLNDVELRFPLQQLMAFSPMLIPFTIDGELQLDLQTIVLNKQGIEAISGNAVLQSVMLKMHDDIILGSYGARLSKDGNELLANVTDISGTVELEGTMKANLQERGYAHDVMLKPKSDAHALIGQALSMAAKKQSDGRYHFSQSGQF